MTGGAWKSVNQEMNTTHIPVARRLYHVPYGKMAKKAHRQVMAIEGKTEAEADASYEREVSRSLDLGIGDPLTVVIALPGRKAKKHGRNDRCRYQYTPQHSN